MRPLPDATEQIEILRDRWGVPHIYAQTEMGATHGQGYAMAGDRLPTMMKAYRTRMASPTSSQGSPAQS